MVSRTPVTAGEVNRPVFKPFAVAIAWIIRAVEPLPLVPAMWITRSLVLGPAQERKPPLHPGKTGLHSPRLQRVDIGQGFGVGHNRPPVYLTRFFQYTTSFPREKGPGERADTSSVKNPGGDLPSSMKGPA